MSFAKYMPDGRREHIPAAVSDDGKLLNVGYDETEGVQKTATLVWNTSTLSWQRATQASGGSGGTSTFPVDPGQHTMAASLPVVVASDQGPIATTQLSAINSWGQSLALTPGATGTLASIVSSAPGYQIKGFIAHGTGEGYWSVQVDSLTRLSGRTRMSMPTLTVTLPNGINVPTGSLVALKVTNESGGTADFEATLLGA